MASDDCEDEALLRLAAAGGSVPARRRLLDTHGSATAALAAGMRDWRSHGLDDAQVHALSHPDENALACTRDWLTEPAHHLLDAVRTYGFDVATAGNRDARSGVPR